jgi:hypothetical protein
VCPAHPKRAPGPQNTAYSRQTMSQNHRPAAPATNPTKKSSLFEVPISNIALDTEQFETIEEALKQACIIEKTGALVELFQDDNPAPVMDFTQVSAS